MKIEIVNWEKYNPRNDVKSTTWFRLENTFWSDPAIFALTNDGRMVWVMLLSLASQRQLPTIQTDLAFVSAVLRIDESVTVAALKHLQAHGKIKMSTLRGRNVRGTAPSRARYDTDGRTDEQTDETNVLPGAPGPGDCSHPELESNPFAGVRCKVCKTFIEKDSPTALAWLAANPPPTEIAPRGATGRRAKPAPSGPSPGGQVWDAYAAAYEARYSHPPVRNVRVNSQCKQLAERLGVDGAVKVAQFYLTHSNKLYVGSAHPIGLCLRDAEGLHTQMLAGYRLTSTEAQQQDANQSNRNAFSAAAAQLGISTSEP